MSVVERLGYAAGELAQNWDSQMWWRHRIGARVIGPFHTRVYPTRKGSTYVLEEDWDVLVVLDACRADLLEEVVDTGRFDAYRRVKSPGSRTPEWTRQNFGGRRLGDTVYVASNGWVSTELDDTFHELIEVWKAVEGRCRPHHITEAAEAAHADHPDKRLIVHYLQPHRPFITSEVGFDEEFTDNPWRALANGEVDRETVWRLYRENLEAVFDEAYDLASGLPGRAVMTADHGNLLGERTYPIPIRLYGHPEGVRHPGLVDVPWGVIESADRPAIVDEGVGRVDEGSAADVRQHLEDLGYA
jgi:hypothetical protein